jgi:tetratricopeptide (TPR) repeat protein
MTRNRATFLSACLLFVALSASAACACLASRGSGSVEEETRVQELLRDERFDEAIELLKTLVKKNPLEKNLWLELAYAARQERDWELLTQAISGALRADPGDTTLAQDLALLYRFQGQMQRADSIYVALLSRTPDSVDIHEARANLYAGQNQTGTGEAILRAYIESHPSNPGGYLALARFMGSENRRTEEILALREGLERAGPERKLLECMAERLRTTEPTGADSALALLVELYPHEQWYPAERGRLAELMGDSARALDFFCAAVYLGTEEVYPEWRVVVSGKDCGPDVDSLPRLAGTETRARPDVVPQEPGAGDCVPDDALLRVVLRRAGTLKEQARAQDIQNLEQRNDLYRSARESKETMRVLHELLSDWLGSLNDEEKVTCLAELAQDYPASVDIALKLAGEYEAAGRTGEAEQEYRRALTLSLTSPQAHIGLGRCLEQRDDTTQAILSYKRGLEVDPTLEEPYAALTRLSKTEERRQDLLRTWEVRLKREPGNALLKKYYQELVLRGKKAGEPASEAPR